MHSGGDITLEFVLEFLFVEAFVVWIAGTLLFCTFAYVVPLRLLKDMSGQPAWHHGQHQRHKKRAPRALRAFRRIHSLFHKHGSK